MSAIDTSEAVIDGSVLPQPFWRRLLAPDVCIMASQVGFAVPVFSMLSNPATSIPFRDSILSSLLLLVMVIQLARLKQWFGAISCLVNVLLWAAMAFVRAV